MKKSIDNEKVNSLCKLSGVISQYRCTRGWASFVYSESDRERLGVVAIAAAIAGMGGQATSAAASASTTEEEADYVEFNLNDKPVKGWVWRSPFKNGDIVDVAAQWHGNHYEAYGIVRPVDKMIALYPHCSRSRGTHIRNAVKWWFIWNIGFYSFMAVIAFFMGMLDMLHEPDFYKIYGPVVFLFVLMFFSLSKQYMPFVTLAERIFLILGLPGARNIDLVKSSKIQRAESDAGEFGTFYFKY